MHMGKQQLVITGDGSHTLTAVGMDEHYHSTHGAVRESEHVFIDYGLDAIELDSINILEVGFGTGLNALLTLMNSVGKRVNYETIEAFPVSTELVEKLNYKDRLNLNDDVVRMFEAMHKCEWDQPIDISSDFQFRKHHCRLEDMQFKGLYDLVYYDAFGPRSQPEMWSVERLSPVVDAISPGGILVTYCAQGAFKRNLRQLGLMVEELPGPPGKRQMTRGRKPS